MGCRQAVKASGFDPDIGGSNPPTPARNMASPEAIEDCEFAVEEGNYYIWG